MSADKQQNTLSEADLATVRQLYGETQNWTRHYEQLIVNANVLIVSACLIFVGLSFGDKVSRVESVALLVVPIFIAAAGIAMTRILFRLYAVCIERLIRFEKLLGCGEPSIDGEGPLIPAELHELPVKPPQSVNFFIYGHVLLIVSFTVLAVFKYLFVT